MKRRAFTLIELMIVVAIFAIISAILVPSFVMARERGRKAAAVRAEATAEAPPDPGGVLPEFTGGTVQMRLSAGTVRVGLDAATRYEVFHQGTFAVAAPAGQLTRLEVPFPETHTEIREAALRFRSADRTWEPEGVIYSGRGLLWAGPLPQDLVEVEIVFLAAGTERFVYELPRSSRMRDVRVAVDLEGIEGSTVPVWALRPTAAQGDRLEWRFDNLVTELPIAVELPASQSPLGRVGTLFRLTGLAVLLFGLGFWYLAELYQPGVLADFRGGGFFLLALAYSVFFVVFAVLGFHGHLSPAVSALVALAAWAPPLVLHTARIVDWRFAFTRALPLGLYTLGLVVNGVYGEAWRDYIYLAATVGLVLFLVGTHELWRETRRLAEQHQQNQLTRRRAALAQLADEARQVLDRAGEALEQPRSSRAAIAQEEVGRCSEGLHEWLKQWGDYQFENVDHLACQERELRHDLESTRRALARLDNLPAPRAEAGGWHCIACGRASDGGPFCSGCGTRLPEKVECGSCHAVMPLPAGALPDRVHCYSCGHGCR